MTQELYIHCFIACIIGNILHVALKIKSLQEDYRIANLEFSVGGYLKQDKWALIVDLLASAVMVYLVDEYLDMDSRIIGKIKTIFVFIGFTGSYVILQLMSVAKSRFRKAVDHKTTMIDTINNTADKPTPAK